jgi:hypothetical protein
MSTFVVPLAIGTLGVILVVIVILVLAAGAYTLITRGNPRQVAVDAERERVAEQSLLSEPVDFESELHPPRDPDA